MERAVATVETIMDIRGIPDADAIVCARIRGWDVVVKKDEFNVGDLCVYVEVDTLVDVTDERFSFLAVRGIRTDAEGNTGHVLKTAKLRGQYSQGLALPVELFPELYNTDIGLYPVPGADVTDFLPVRRWNPPMPANLAGSVHGRIPGWIPVTDEERIENTTLILKASDLNWVATEKLDGTSTTVWVNPDNERNHGVCSRNYDLVMDSEQTQWALIYKAGYHETIEQEWPGSRVAIQGETVGEGIQGNPLKLRGQHFVPFTLRVDGKEIPRCEWPEWLLKVAVPVYTDLSFPATVEEAVAQVDTLQSLYSPGHAAEGVVWRAQDTPSATIPLDTGETQTLRASFKAISRKYLMKHDR